MESHKPAPLRANPARSPKPISLKELAKRLNLSPTSLSLVLSGSPAASSIPKATQDLIIAAARTYNYRPNFLARSLRAQRTFAVGVIMPELSEGYSALILSGVEDYLRERGFMHLTTSHRHDEALIESSLNSLRERGVEGIIAVDTPLRQTPAWLRTVSVSSHERIAGISSVILNHDTAAELALSHLREFGHRDIAVIQGQAFSSDSEARLNAILTKAAQLGIAIPARRIAQLEGRSPTPEPGYRAARELLNAGPFTALFSFNDISAIGAIRAFRDAGLRVPEDISVVGFDDVPSAAYQTPSLTTIRQPLREMGRIAAEILLKGIGSGPSDSPEFIQVEPELIVRESTAPLGR